MKYSDYNLYEMRNIIELGDGNLTVLSGKDEVFLPALIMGADGAVGLTLNFMPELFVRLLAVYNQGKLEEAKRFQFKANRIIKVLNNYELIPAVKTVMEFIGFDCSNCREPLKTMSSEEKVMLRQNLEKVGFSFRNNL